MTTVAERTIGPVEYAVFEFKGNRFSGKILPALQDLVEAGTVRIIDLIVVKKDADGSGVALELAELDEDEAALFDSLDGEVGELLSDSDVEIVLDGMDNNTTAALIVWENVWAARLAKTIREANGRVIAQERIPADVVDLALAEAQSR